MQFKMKNFKNLLRKMEEIILKDNKRINDLKYPNQDIEDLIGAHDYNMLLRFYDDPFQFDAEESVKLIDILYKHENSKLDDFAMLSILKHNLTELGTYTKRGKFLLDEVYGVKYGAGPSIDYFCSNFDMSLKWLILNQDQYSTDDLHSVSMGKPELLNLVFVSPPRCPDQCFRHAILAEHLDHAKWFYLKYPVSNSERQTSLLMSDNRQIVDFLMGITKFEDRLHLVDTIKSCVLFGNYHVFIKLVELMNTNNWSFTSNDKKTIVLSVIKCDHGNSLDMLQYFHSFGLMDIYEDSIFEQAFISNYKIFEWLVSLDTEDKFNDSERLDKLTFSRDFRCVKLLTRKGYKLNNILLQTKSVDNAGILSTAAIIKNFEVLKQHNSKIDVLRHSYPHISIDAIMNILDVTNVEDKIKLFKNGRCYLDDDLLTDFYNNFKDELNDDMKNDLFTYCCSESWYEGLSLITNNGAITDFKNKQENFLKSIRHQDLRVLNLLYSLGDIKVSEFISERVCTPYMKKWLNSKVC